MHGIGSRLGKGLKCLLVVAAMAVAVISLSAAKESDDQEVIGTIEWLSTQRAVVGSPAVQMDLDPSHVFDGVDHVANGVALRNRVSGTIHLRGVPLGSRVVMALLYWNFSDGHVTGPDEMPVLFDGNLVMGKKTADSDDPCWGMGGNHSFMANVTEFVSHLGHPNQDYEVVLVFGEANSTTGQDPWISYESQEVRTEGATLVVIFENDMTSGPLFVYDAFGGSMFWSTATFNLHHAAASGDARFTMAGADGQLNAPGELTFFDGQQIAGCPVTNSDWDGSDGWPSPQLWDTHLHSVFVNGSVSVVEYQSQGDCLVPVVLVLDLK